MGGKEREIVVATCCCSQSVISTDLIVVLLPCLDSNEKSLLCFVCVSASLPKWRRISQPIFTSSLEKCLFTKKKHSYFAVYCTNFTASSNFCQISLLRGFRRLFVCVQMTCHIIDIEKYIALTPAELYCTFSARYSFSATGPTNNSIGQQVPFDFQPLIITRPYFRTLLPSDYVTPCGGHCLSLFTRDFRRLVSPADRKEMRCRNWKLEGSQEESDCQLEAAFKMTGQVKSDGFCDASTLDRQV